MGSHWEERKREQGGWMAVADLWDGEEKDGARRSLSFEEGSLFFVRMGRFEYI